MASTQSSSSFLSRTRSGRVPANTSRLVTTTTAANTSNYALSAGASSSATATAPTASAVSPSNISLFLTNLRLLDLDLLPDWPGINPLTFTNRDAAQGQKKRIQCVEWALFRLFELWDVDETRNKLQPFFPPLDQVQSLNLRAALLRGLDQAKKTGVLGRDAVVRKTMLDECKGERLEEVLAVFSSAVLKKLVAEAQLNGDSYAAIGQTMALENRGYSGETTELVVLALAHRASLNKTLREKNAARGRYKDLAQRLNLKERSIARRQEQLRELDRAAARGGGSADDMGEDEKMALWRTVRNNWSGNERWMETLLFGDAQSQKDGVLTAPFDRVWRRVQSGRLSELESQSGGGLLSQLDDRVKTQKDRLLKWQQFRRDMFGTDTAREDREQKRKSLGGRPVMQQKGIDLGFGPHENLHLGRMSPRKLPVRAAASMKPEYAALVDGLQSALDAINKGAPNPFAAGARRVSGSAAFKKSTDSLHVDASEETISELSELEEELAISADPLPLETRSQKSASSQEQAIVSSAATTEPPERKRSVHRDDTRATETRLRRAHDTRRPTSLYLDRSTTLQPSTSVANQQKSPTAVSLDRSPVPSPIDPPRTPSPARSSSGRREQWQPSEKPTTSDREAMPPPPPPPPPSQLAAVSQTQKMADQILASMHAASPSPEKKKPRHTLSLAERTRMSMARGHALADDNEDDEIEIDALRLRRYNSTSNNNRKSKARSTATATGAAAATANGSRRDDGTTIHEGVVVVTPATEEETAEAPPLEEEEEENDLVARTRKSMANFEATRQKVQLERRRSERKAARQSNAHHHAQQPSQSRRHGGSSMPSTMEEEVGNESSMLAEEMIQRGVDDYESVFMSRPKIKTSPAVTPTRELMEYEG